MRIFRHAVLLFALTLVTAPQSMAQEAKIAFGGLKQDTSLPVEVQADQLSVDNASGKAVFSGNVLVGQGEMRLSAQTATVEYDAGGKSIARLLLSGGVTITNKTDAAEAREAVYTIATGEVVMTGDVLLTQGSSAMSGQNLVIDLKAGTGRMEGRVQTTFIPGDN